MHHPAKAQFRYIIIYTLPLAKDTRSHITLTFSCPKKNISAASLFNHSFCDIVMFIFITILFQFRSIHIPDKMSLYLISAILEISVIRQIIPPLVLNWTYPLGLCLYWIHNPHFIDDPYDCRLPIYAMHNPF